MSFILLNRTPDYFPIHISGSPRWLCWWVALIYFAWISPVFSSTCNDKAEIPLIKLSSIASGLSEPVAITHAGDNSARIFITEQQGRIRILQRDTLIEKPFLDITDRVSSGGEKGLLSLAFHPDYKKNGYFYVNYTAYRGLRLYTVVSRFTRSTDNQADHDSELVIIEIAQPFPNHNGGQIAFGPDGYLYIGMGDGGFANDPFENAQNSNTLLGALLRLDVNNQDKSLHYAIPADNPFLSDAEYRPEIWAYGLRNPWRFSFDRKTGRLYLADVGQDDVEEINHIRKGGNYGWDVLEGNRCLESDDKCKQRKKKYIAPIFTYPHPVGFAVTGGIVYRGKEFPMLCGIYFYADYVTKTVWGLRYDGVKVTNQKMVLQSEFNISSFGENEDGEIFVAGHQSGKIMKIVYSRKN